MSLSVREYLSRAKDQTVPPLVLELILRSGKSFYIKNVFAFDKQAEMVALRVWDVRALAQADLDTVLRRLSAVQSRDELENIERLHPKLVTAEYRIAKRPAGHVLVDYNQNAWGRTLASIYSVRPKPRAPVSTPR